MNIFQHFVIGLSFYVSKNTPDKTSMKRERLDGRKHENVTKRVMTLRKYHQSDRKIVVFFSLIFYDFKSGLGPMFARLMKRYQLH